VRRRATIQTSCRNCGLFKEHDLLFPFAALPLYRFASLIYIRERCSAFCWLVWDVSFIASSRFYRFDDAKINQEFQMAMLFFQLFFKKCFNQLKIKKKKFHQKMI
jgi:hypothetical protein